MNDENAARVALRARVLALIGDGPIPRLREALTHPSYANETSCPHNQRLEFLGDAVLGLCVSELLVAAYPKADEGLLSRMRSALVNADALAAWARRIDLGDAMDVGRGARSDRYRTNVLADAVEALVAAVYDARGLDGARALVRHVVGEGLVNAAALGERDPKSALQERVQARGQPSPWYRVVASHGPVHAQVFEVEVLVADVVVGRGEGPSKRLAERAAAQAALAAETDGAA